MARKIPWIGTSWKMNKLRRDAQIFATTLRDSNLARSSLAQPFVIPPFPYIAEVAEILQGTQVKIGAQNIHWEDEGAWTGEVSAPMVKDCGANIVEIGHSERRTFFNETDETVGLKVEAALRHGLTALVCLGDTKAEFETGQTAEALKRQTQAALRHTKKTNSANIIFAYEPVWSIGVGGVPADPAFANEQHRNIKAWAEEAIGASCLVLYGGSVNPSNCRELAACSYIDGLFIGRSAWKAENYIAIVESVTEHLGGLI